ncbi:MAG: non-canonical purine NTP pyrophosphatase, RdgB/HAM1 family [Proteobacteria bacterium]|nr:MAG: non-canonical purine NTP pyrophosphatase, RdgB/HAM1 family [Pseudomonadota bacterium]
MKKLIIASNNAKKRQEITVILGELGIEIVAADATAFVHVEEDADSFSGNARKKAEAFAHANNLPALADDSGLCVDALNGAPGLYSARFAGESASDADNNAKLLQLLDGKDHRRAHFTCALHLAYPDNTQPLSSEGQVDGEILKQAVGDSGFGYDPLFFCPELGKAFASASPEEKASVSHRGRALRSLAEQLKNKPL